MKKIMLMSRFLEYAKFLPPQIKKKNLIGELSDLNRANFDLFYQNFEETDNAISDVNFEKQMRKNASRTRIIMEKLDGVRCELVARSADDVGVSGVGSEPEITLSNLKLVDTTTASIPQILEFREDEESRNKLLRLRSFVRKDCSGLAINQIEDELMIALDDYKKASKKWDFKTKTGSISTLLGSKEALVTVAGSLLAAVSGAPLVSVAAASLGTAFTIGKIGLNVVEKKFSKREELGSSPVSYIVHAKRSLAK
jgi:hypothetical protein